jgi:hypothetical protein
LIFDKSDQILNDDAYCQASRSATRKRNEQGPAHRDQTTQLNLISSRFVLVFFLIFFYRRIYKYDDARFFYEQQIMTPIAKAKNLLETMLGRENDTDTRACSARQRE